MFEANRRIFLQSFALGVGTLAASRSFAAGNDRPAAGCGASGASGAMAAGFSGNTITLALGTGSVYRLPEPFGTVLIGDPDVVDVNTQDDRSVILKARKLGASNIVFLDKQSIAIVNIRVVVCDAQI